MRYATLFAVFILITGSGLAYYFSNNASWHQKLTLHLNTPNGEISASGVIKVMAKHRMNIAGTGGQYFSVRGEALSVDLGQGRYLFALLNGQETALYQTMKRLGLIEDGNEFSNSGLIKRQRDPLEVAIADAPLLVTFGDLSDPASVMRVDPADLALSFGAGFALREITLEVTDDAVTEGKLAEVIPCIKAGKGCSWHDLGLPYSDPLSHLNGAFIRRSK